MHRTARFILSHTTALALCLVWVSILCAGFTQGEVIALRALEHLGEPYVFGAEGPDKFDCSGLVMYCLIPEGFEFTLHSAELIGADERYRYIATPRQLITGDIVCFDTINDRDPCDHMGIYLGGNQFVHASSSGEVKISTLEDFYLERFTGARRYAQVYSHLVSPAQLQRALDDAGVTAWFESLGIKEWFENLGIREWFEGQGIGEWFAGIDIPGKFDSLKGKAADLWSSIFGKS